MWPRASLGSALVLGNQMVLDNVDERYDSHGYPESIAVAAVEFFAWAADCDV
jgi:hypothetical protein